MKLFLQLAAVAIVGLLTWSVSVHSPAPENMPIGCFTTNGPVPSVCVKNYHAPKCATEDGNDGVSDCWWTDPKDGRVWYQPK